MRLLPSFPVLSYVLVLIGIVGLCIAQNSAGLLLVAGILAALSWYVTEGPRGRSLPGWVAAILLVAVCLNAIVDLTQHTGDKVGVLGRFSVWLTLIKLYQRKSARDHAQLLMLSLLLMLTGCLQSSDFLFSVVVMIYAVLGLYVLMLFQLYASYETSQSARRKAPAPADRLAPALRPILGRHAVLHFRSLVIAVGLSGLLLSAMLFVIFPRSFGEGFVGRVPSPQPRRRIGFSEEVDLLRGGRITEARHHVLSMRLVDDAGEPMRLEPPLRLRGAVLDRYVAPGVWRAPERRGVHMQTSPPAPLPLADASRVTGRLVTQEIECVVPTDVVFALYPAVSIGTERPIQFVYDEARQTLRQVGPGRLRRYVVTSQTPPTGETFDAIQDRSTPPWRPASGYSDLRVRRQAVRLLRSAGLPASAPVDQDERWRWNEDATRAFVEHLRGELFTYTLDLSDVVARRDPGADFDPVAQFLFETRRGHCEFFASALTALCHTVGIEARIVTGYLAYGYDETSQLYTVLASNAHAWTEIRTGTSAWTPFDPTPPAVLRELHDIPSTLADRMRWMYERFEGTWSDRFIAFDRSSQRELAETLDIGWSQRLRGTLGSVQRWLERVNRAFYLGPAGYIWMGIVGLAVVIAVVAVVKLTRRSLAIRRTLRLRHVPGAEQQQMVRQLGFYLDMLSLLERGGCEKPVWKPPLQYAAELVDDRPAIAPMVRELTDLFYAARYGRHPLEPEELEQTRLVLRRLAASLRVRL